MKRRLLSASGVRPLIAMCALLAVFLPAQRTFAVTEPAPSHASSHPCIVAGGSGDGTYVRNFNPFNGSMDFATGAIYEPLTFYSITGHHYNWLASSVKYDKTGKTLTLKLRHGVQWSDGTPMTSADVVFTLTMGTINTALDKIGYVPRDTSNVARVTAPDKYTVQIHLRKRDVTFLADFNNVYVFPKHIWSKVKNPTTWLDPNPVGTGPYTRITKFNGQEYILSKNPHYWQKGRPYAQCIEKLSETGNDAALLAMAHGDIDWTHNFVPDAQKSYVARDPQHFHYWYAGLGTGDGLFVNDQKYPFSLPVLRQAMSMALDRKKIVKQAEYGYAPVSDALGMNKAYPGWEDPSLKALNKKLSTYNPTAALQMLENAGFKMQGNTLIDPHGDPVSFDAHVIGGWTDWVLQLQIESSELSAIGIQMNVKLDPDWGTWIATAYKTLTPHLIWTFGFPTPTPYGYFYSLMSQKSFKGAEADESGTGNFAQYYNPQATALLNQFNRTVTKSGQRKIAYKLEKLFLNNLPYIPIFIGDTWYTYSTKYFTGWPDKKHPYADTSSWGTGAPEVVVFLTHVKPVK